MEKKIVENYEVEDFVTDESFLNYHFRLIPEDVAFWEQWIQQNPAKASLITAAKEMASLLSIVPAPEEWEAERSRMENAIASHAAAPTKKTGGRIRSVKGSGYLKYAASVIILLSCLSGYFLYQSYKKPTFHLTGKYNHTDRVLVFLLSDGTRISLAPQSNLTYPENFTGKTREVFLNGEAQFEVQKDSSHPFKVHAGSLIATVMGTVFTVKQREDSVTQVELLEGKLKVETLDSPGIIKHSVILNPAEKVIYKRISQNFYTEISQPHQTPADKLNHLAFQQDDFEAVAKKIKDVFGVTVINRSAKKSWRFTGKLSGNTAEDIVKDICLIKDLSYEIKGNIIFIK